MKKEFNHKEQFTIEYRFWDNLWTTLILEANYARRDLSDNYIYDKYETIFTSLYEKGYTGPVRLTSVECPDKMETFFKLKYKDFK